MSANKIQIKRITFSAFLIAVGLVLPQLFHLIGGTAAGTTMLPMHIPVLLAGLLLGPAMGISVGVILPFVSSILLAMPPALRLPFMMVELFTYGFTSGFLMKKTDNVWLSLIIAQICGRIAYGLALVLAIYVIQIPAPALTAFLPGIISGLPGLVVQWLLIPILVHVFKGRIKLD